MGCVSCGQKKVAKKESDENRRKAVVNVKTVTVSKLPLSKMKIKKE